MNVRLGFFREACLGVRGFGIEVVYFFLSGVVCLRKGIEVCRRYTG